MALQRKRGRPRGPSYLTMLRFRVLKRVLLESPKWPFIRPCLEALDLPERTYHRHARNLLWGDPEFVGRLASRYLSRLFMPLSIEPVKNESGNLDRVKRLAKLLRELEERAYS